ncbi:MAG: TolC family protein, partial [Pseudomonadota bacterium]
RESNPLFTIYILYVRTPDITDYNTLRRGILKKIIFWAICAFIPMMASVGYARTVNIALLQTEIDGGVEISHTEVFKREFNALFEGEHKLNYIEYAAPGDASPQDIQNLMSSAYAHNKVEYLLVLDVAANQVAGLRKSYPKPTLLPLVLNAALQGYPQKDGGSGVKNLHYITQDINLGQKIRKLQNVAKFRSAVLIVDPKMAENLDVTTQRALLKQAQDQGVTLKVIPYLDDENTILQQFPPQTEVVLYSAFPSKSKQQIKSLMQAVNVEKSLPSFSLSGSEYVKYGALATYQPDTDFERLARRTALHLQDMLYGTPAAELPVYFQTKNRLLINMATSRQIKFAPSFDVISDAELINVDDEKSDIGYSLTAVARKAIDENLSIAVQKLQAELAGQRVDEVRGSLLPRFDAGLSYDRRKRTGNTRTGIFPEDTTDANVTLSQPLFNESLWAAFTIEKFNALSQEELLRETELDIIQSAVNAYLNVLREQTSLQQERYNLNITRENYWLAETRVDVGDSDKSDLYRWESELANAKQAVLEAKSRLEQHKQELNRILNRPINEAFATTIETLDNPNLLVSDARVTKLITNRYSLNALVDFFVEKGLQRSPELKQIQAQLDADQRQFLSDKRAYWVPDVNLNAQYTNNIDETRSNLGVGAVDDDWTVGVEVSLPLYEGGARAARKAQSRLSIMQGRANLRDTKNTIEQQIRSQMEEAHASYQSITLAKTSEKASQRNYDLISSSYAQGQVSITDVLNAQDALIEAREASMNATYAFLIDLMNLQRATGAFDFFLTDTERVELSQNLVQHINGRSENMTETQTP